MPATATPSGQPPQANAPIAVFDSGVGGLTVLHELLVALPQEDFLYLGDSARFPYGDRSPTELQAFAREIADVLLGRGAKLLVVACNSATSAALEEVGRHVATGPHPVDVIGVVGPESNLAVASTRTGRIGLLATPATVASGAYERAVLAADPLVRLESVACPELAALVQHDVPFTEEVLDTVRGYCGPLRAAGVDTVILGSTHYPLVRPMLQRILGPDVTFVTSGHAIARRVEHALALRGLARERDREGRYDFLCTGDADAFARAGTRFLQLPIAAVEHVTAASGAPATAHDPTTEALA